MKVLVVGGAGTITTAVRERLVEEGFTIDVVADAAAAVDRAAYDIVALDAQTDDAGSYQALGVIRQRGLKAPVLLVRTDAADGCPSYSIDLDGNDYLTRPYRFIVLVGLLMAITPRAGAEPPMPIRVGSLLLDPSRRHVERSGTVIPLTAREFSLLSFLVLQAGQVVSKAEILEHVWHFDRTQDANLVEVYISYVRRKIDKAFGLHTLHTVRGFGYRLDADDPDHVLDGIA